METYKRVLDPSSVEIAEQARQRLDFYTAADVINHGLGLERGVLTAPEISAILPDQDQRLILACLARLQVDVNKYLANRAFLPWKVLPYLEIAGATINNIYHHDGLRRRLINAKEDHLGRPYFFLVEMARDEAKVCEAAMVLYGRSRAERLRAEAFNILRTTYYGISENNPVRPLVSIEQQILAAKYGDNLDTPRLLDDLSKLVILDSKSNPERVVTIASQLMAWGEKRKQQELYQEASVAYNKVLLTNPSFAGRFNIERGKLRMQAFRSLLVHILLPKVSSESRDKLFKSLISETGS